MRVLKSTTNSASIVLSADRTLMGHYRTLLDGMMSTVQTTFVPTAVHRTMLSPAIKTAGQLNSPIAPLGLRKLEAALVASGTSREDVTVVIPDDIKKAVGEQTKVVGISSGDPLGLGMTGTTMVDMLGGKLHTQLAFEQLCNSLIKLRRKKDYKFKVIAGGPGAWQLANNPEKSRSLGIDCVFRGYVEADAKALFDKLSAGEKTEFIIDANSQSPAGQHKILAPSNMGIVEISRGCCLGCKFCSLARVPMTHADKKFIADEIRTNIAGGMDSISLISEDLLRYGSVNGTLQPDALFEMLEHIRKIDGLKMLQVDHVNISSVMQFTDAQLDKLRQFLRPEGHKGQDLLWVNLGVESADGELLAKSGMKAKMHPATSENWAEVCRESILRLERAGFVPMVSLVMGMEGETHDSVAKTLKLVQSLKGHRVTVFPIFIAPIDTVTKPFARSNMSRLHWQLLKQSYEFNFKWIPRMFADNQYHGSVGWPIRAFVQVAGKFQTCVWKGKFMLNCKGGGF